MGGCFKLPYVHATRWPAELDELRAAGHRLLALHLQGSVSHHEAIPLPPVRGGGAADGGEGGEGGAAPFAVVVGAEAHARAQWLCM